MDVKVPVKVWLPQELYRDLSGHAVERDTDVAGLLARLAAASIKPHEPTQRITLRHVTIAREMRALGYTWPVIGKHLGYTGNGIAMAVKRADQHARDGR